MAGQVVEAVAVGIIGAVGRPGKEARGWEEWKADRWWAGDGVEELI